MEEKWDDAVDKQTILVVDDEREIADLIEIHLLSEGYRVFKANSGEDALATIRRADVHMVVLDIMMPGMDGFEVCRRIREAKNIPILMLSARSQTVDKVLGLRTGADDYMTKPFDPLELTARVRAQLRRFTSLNPAASQVHPDGVISIRGLVIDTIKHTVMLDDREIYLTPTEYGILALLAGSPGRVFSSEEIFELVWQERYLQSNNTVMVHIRKIREKLERDPANPEFIKTVWGVGYKVED